MSDQPVKDKSSESIKKVSDQSTRRQTLKALTVGGAVVGVSSLPQRWTRPVIDSIVLPAHAETTEPYLCDVSCNINVNMNWSFTSSHKEYRDVMLEMVTPGGTRLIDNDVPARCLQFGHHDGPGLTGDAEIYNITENKVAGGRYQLFVNIGEGTGGGYVSIVAEACGNFDSSYGPYGATGVYQVGSINVSQGGTATVRVDI